MPGLIVILEVVVWLAAMVISLGTTVFTLICNYKIFKKAGYEGWEAIVPFYNSYIFSEITMGKGIWFLLTFIPCAGIFAAFFMTYRLGMAFRKSTGFNIGLMFVPVVFMAILAFSKDNTYQKLPPL